MEIRERAQNLCEACRDKGIYVFDNLEVHHITKVRDDESRLLDDSNLVCLCRECHRRADAGEIDESYLRELARKRDEG
jgi:5-methylcytosine-specific restriction endonuclease McrA